MSSEAREATLKMREATQALEKALAALIPFAAVASPTIAKDAPAATVAPAMLVEAAKKPASLREAKEELAKVEARLARLTRT